MANICVGSLKIRGDYEDVKRWAKDVLKNQLDREVKTEEKEDYLHLESCAYNDPQYTQYSNFGFYFEGSDCWSNVRTIYIDKNRKTHVFPIKAKYSFNTEEWRKISEKYHLDIKLYGFEKGMEVNQQIEIHQGEIKNNLEIRFEDYNWDCVMPHLGG